MKNQQNLKPESKELILKNTQETTLVDPPIRGTPFRTFVNYREEAPDAEHNSGELITQPNEALTVREIIDKYARGIPVEQDQSFNYEPEDMDSSDFDHLDYFEQQEYLREHREYIKELEELAKSFSSSADGSPQEPAAKPREAAKRDGQKEPEAPPETPQK